MTKVAKIQAESFEEGRATGLEQGLEQGMATVYRQWQAWNTRRMEAEAKGEPFNEPPPTPPKNGTPTDAN